MEENKSILSLELALKQFCEWGSTKYAPQTVHTYRGLINKFIEQIKNKPLDEITIVDITDYFISLKKKNYHLSSIAHMMISVRVFFKFLFLQKRISWDYQLIGIPKYVSNSFPPIQLAQFQEMVKIDTKDFATLRNKTIISFLYASGVRVSELCDIKISDLKLDEQYGNIISKKNMVKRMIFWDKATAELLKEYLPAREKIAKCDYMVIACDKRCIGNKLTTRSVQRIVERYRTSSEITPHSFRHGLGMRAVHANIHPRYIQKILGHKNINSSQIYLDTLDLDVVEAYKKIAA